MNVLALDTASPMPAVALASEGQSWEERLSSDRRASEELLAAIARVLQLAGIELSRSERIVAFAGPGSFTGTRVGLATAWGLGRALEIPVERVSTLEGMAEAARTEGVVDLQTALDAGRGEILVQPFSLREARARASGPLERLPREKALARLGGGALVALPEDLLGPTAHRLRTSPARAMALAAALLPRAVEGAAAIYARASAAEEKLGAP